MPTRPALEVLEARDLPNGFFPPGDDPRVHWLLVQLARQTNEEFREAVAEWQGTPPPWADAAKLRAALVTLEGQRRANLRDLHRDARRAAQRLADAVADGSGPLILYPLIIDNTRAQNAFTRAALDLTELRALLRDNRDATLVRAARALERSWAERIRLLYADATAARVQLRLGVRAGLPNNELKDLEITFQEKAEKYAQQVKDTQPLRAVLRDHP
jgi:hypothetical protein